MILVNYFLDARGVATLTLNRPEKLNAFSKELCEHYLNQLSQLEKDIQQKKARIAVIDTSSDKAFCAGADLKEREAMNESQISEQLNVQRQMMDRTAALAIPTIAMLRGVAFGGGLELALACDFRLAKPTAQLGLTETRLGIIPGSGGTQRLTRLVGVARAKELILLAKRVTATEGVAIGIINCVDEDLGSALESYVSAILEAGPLALISAKRSIDEGAALPLAKALDVERECYERVLKSKDRVEGLQAFLEKRKPRYQGH